MVTILLVCLAVVAGVAGLASLSESTTGIGLIAFGCLIGVLARIAQAAGSRALDEASHTPLAAHNATPATEAGKASDSWTN